MTPLDDDFHEADAPSPSTTAKRILIAASVATGIVLLAYLASLVSASDDGCVAVDGELQGMMAPMESSKCMGTRG